MYIVEIDYVLIINEMFRVCWIYEGRVEIFEILEKYVFLKETLEISKYGLFRQLSKLPVVIRNKFCHLPILKQLFPKWCRTRRLKISPKIITYIFFRQSNENRIKQSSIAPAFIYTSVGSINLLLDSR